MKIFFSRIRSIIRLLAIYTFDSLLILLFYSYNKSIKNTIIIVRIDGIGDFILWLESARKLIEQYKGKKIVFICNSRVADLAKKVKIFDLVIPIDVLMMKNNLLYRLRIFNQVNNLKAYIAIQPTYSRQFLIGDSLIRASNSKHRVGLEGDNSRSSEIEKFISNNWYTKLMPIKDKIIKHEILRNIDFVSFITNDGYCPIKLANLPKFINYQKRLIPKDDYFIISLGGSKEIKRWSEKSFAQVAIRIYEKYKFKIVICGDFSEQIIAKKFISLTGLKDYINLVGKTDIETYIEIIRGAKILIANDSSAIHIAAAVKTPSVCILGGAHFGRFLPYPDLLTGTKPVSIFKNMNCFGCNWKCTSPHKTKTSVPCISEISPKIVVKECFKILEKRF